jgi:hypothetical protein
MVANISISSAASESRWSEGSGGALQFLCVAAHGREGHLVAPIGD